MALKRRRHIDNRCNKTERSNDASSPDASSSLLIKSKKILNIALGVPAQKQSIGMSSRKTNQHICRIFCWIQF